MTSSLTDITKTTQARDDVTMTTLDNVTPARDTEDIQGHLVHCLLREEDMVDSDMEDGLWIEDGAGNVYQWFRQVRGCNKWGVRVLNYNMASSIII